MLNSISVLSLAYNIIQIVDFSLEIVIKFRELYKNNISSKNRELEDIVVRLKSLRVNLIIVDRITKQFKSIFNNKKKL